MRNHIGDRNIKNQKLEENYDIVMNKNVEIDLPEIFSLKNKYKYNSEIEIENCTIDYKKNKIIINTNNLGKDRAIIKVKGGKFDGSQYTINYNAVEDLKISKIEIEQKPNKTVYLDGENFDPTGMKVNVVYENGTKVEINDYNVSKESLKKEDTYINIVYQNLEIQQEINVLDREKCKVISFKDRELYTEVIDNLKRKNIEYVGNDKLNQIYVVNEQIEKITSLYVGEEKEISDLTGLGEFYNLKELLIGYGSYSDISEIAKLKKLERLSLWRNKFLTDISQLKDLENLKIFGMEETNVKDISCLKNVKYFTSINCKLENIGDMDIKNMEDFDVEDCMNFKELKHVENKVYLPHWFKYLVNNNIITKAQIYSDEDKYNAKYNEIDIKCDNNNNVYIELDKEVTEEKPGSKRKVILNYMDETGKFFIDYTINYDINEINNDLSINSDIYTIDENNIYNISPNTTLNELLSNCEINGNAEIYKKTGEKLGENELVGTGMILEISKDSKKIEFTIGVTGDLNGNGEIEISDLVMVRKHIQEISNQEGIYFKVGDINKDNSLDITDLVRIRKHIQEIEVIK